MPRHWASSANLARLRQKHCKVLIFPLDSVPGTFTSTRTDALPHDFEQSRRIFKVDSGPDARSVEDGQLCSRALCVELPR